MYLHNRRYIFIQMVGTVALVVSLAAHNPGASADVPPGRHFPTPPRPNSLSVVSCSLPPICFLSINIFLFSLVLTNSCVNASIRLCLIHQVMEYPAHDLPVTGLGFAPREAGEALGGYDLLAGSADYKITLFKSQGEGRTVSSC